MDDKRKFFTSCVIHSAVAWRLFLAAAIISLLIGFISVTTLRERFIELVDAVTKVSANRINQHFLPLLDTPARISPENVEKYLGSYPARHRAALEQGQFIIVRVTDLSGRLLAEIKDETWPDLLKVVPELPLLHAPAGGGRPVFHTINDDPYLLVEQPLVNSQDQPVLLLDAVFAVSDKARANYRWQIARTLILSLGVILATSLMLYPLLMALYQRVIRLSQDLLLANLDTIRTLGSAIAKRDSDTDAHNYRVTLYCVALGEKMELDRSTIRGLIKGAFLHDIGKIGIHDRILLKPGKLDAEEFAEMKRHVDYGQDIVNRCRWLQDAAEVVSCHHEKYAGNGYPLGLQGESIPLSARIFAVTDVFDALSSSRPYKDPMPLSRCREILIEERGKHFDPVVVDVFLELAPELHTRYGECDTEQLRSYMPSVVVKYFDVEEGAVLIN